MRYAKAIVQLVGAVISFILLATVDGSPGGASLTVAEWCQVVVMTLGVVPVYLVPNTVIQNYAKGIVAGTVAVAALVPAVVDGGVTLPEVVQLVLAGLTAAGVLVVRNAGTTTGPPQV